MLAHVFKTNICFTCYLGHTLRFAQKVSSHVMWKIDINWRRYKIQETLCIEQCKFFLEDLRACKRTQVHRSYLNIQSNKVHITFLCVGISCIYQAQLLVNVKYLVSLCILVSFYRLWLNLREGKQSSYNLLVLGIKFKGFYTQY